MLAGTRYALTIVVPTAWYKYGMSLLSKPSQPFREKLRCLR